MGEEARAPSPGALDLAGWREALRHRVKDLYATMRGAYEAAPFLVSAVALGGLHGYGPEGAQNPLGGAITGFTKTWARERPTAVAKAVDFAPGTPADVVAAALLAETETDPGVVEVGHCDGRRWGIGLVVRDVALPTVDAFGPDRVFLVTGAAGSIVSAITADLARACGGGTFYLLDLTPEPPAGEEPSAQEMADALQWQLRRLEAMQEAGVRLMLLVDRLPNSNDDQAVRLLGPAPDSDQHAGLWACLRQGSDFGPGTGRHEELPCWYLPLRGRHGAHGAALLSVAYIHQLTSINQAPAVKNCWLSLRISRRSGYCVNYWQIWTILRP